MRPARGQTTFDYAIGMSIFLLTVVFVLAFIPGVVQPFQNGPQEETVVADRVADQVSKGMLADPTDPHVLRVDCARSFFDPLPGGSGDCRFDETLDLTSGATLADQLGLSDRQRVNVTVRADTDGDGDTEVLCEDSTGTVGEQDDLTCTTTYRIGPTAPTEVGSVVSARRVVSVDGHRARLVVRAW